MKQAGFSPILVVVLIVVAAIGGYLVYTNYSNNRTKLTPPQPAPSSSDITHDSTTSAANPAPNGAGETVYTEQSRSANWKTYMNIKYAYQFKYPTDHTVYSDVDQRKPTLIPAISTSDKAEVASTEEMVFCCEPATLSFLIEVTNKSARQRAEEYLDVPEWEAEKPEVEDIVFSELPAVEASGRGGYGPPYKLIVVQRNNLLLIIEQNGDDPLLNQILSTFRFLP